MSNVFKLISTSFTNSNQTAPSNPQKKKQVDITEPANVESRKITKNDEKIIKSIDVSLMEIEEMIKECGQQDDREAALISTRVNTNVELIVEEEEPPPAYTVF